MSIDTIEAEKQITKKNIERAIGHCMGELAINNKYCWVNAGYYNGEPLSNCQDPVKVEGEFKYRCKLNKYLPKR